MADIYDNSSLLMFRVGPVYCCAPSFPVDGIIPPPEMTRTPGSDIAHPGLFKHGGHMVSGLDLRYQFGVEQHDWVKPGRVIVAGVEAGVVGFWVDEIIEVMQMPQSGWGSLPPLLPRGVFSRTLLFDKNIYLYSEFEKLFKIPASGYLRKYIEYLIEQQNTEQQSISKTVAQAATATRRVTTLNTTKTANTVLSKTESKDTQEAKSTIPNNVVPLSRSAEDNKQDKPAEDSKVTPVKRTNDISRNTHRSNINEHKTDQRSKLAGTVDTASTVAGRSMQKNNPDKASLAKRQPINRSTAQTTKTVSTPASSGIDLKKSNASSRYSSQKAPGQPASRPEPVKPATTLITEKAGNNLKTLESESSAFWPILILLLLFGGSGFFVYWYVISEPSSKVVKNELTNAQKEQDVWRPAETRHESAPDSIANDPEPVPVVDVAPEKTRNPVQEYNSLDSEPEQIDTEPAAPATVAPELPATHAIQSEATESENNIPTDENNAPADYKADIVQDEQGVTIILEAPEDDETFKPISRPETTEPADTESQTIAIAKTQPPEDDTIQPTDTTITTPNDSQANSVSLEVVTENNKTEQESAVRVESEEIVHIVKKGDTLWHIAIRYVNNPYRYPELARLSNIKNPDLIYPGNRVRIIKRKRIRE